MRNKRKLWLIVTLVIALLLPQAALMVSAEQIAGEPIALSGSSFYQGDVSVIVNMIDNNVFPGYWSRTNPEFWPVTWTEIAGVYRITGIGEQLDWWGWGEAVVGNIDLSGLTELRVLRLQNFSFGEVDRWAVNLTGLTNLHTLLLFNLDVSETNFSELVNLTSLEIRRGVARSINLNGLNKLEDLFVYGTELRDDYAMGGEMIFPNGSRLSITLDDYGIPPHEFRMRVAISLGEVSITTRCYFIGSHMRPFSPVWEATGGVTIEDNSNWFGNLIKFPVPTSDGTITGRIGYDGAVIRRYGDFYYAELADGTAAIVGSNRSDRNPVVPSVIDGKTVAVIGEGAFATLGEDGGCPGEGRLVGVTIPYTVTKIRANAFFDNDLRNVTFAKGSQLETIGRQAFAINPYLTSISFPEGLREIGTYAFLPNWWEAGDYGLKEIDFPSTLERVGADNFRNTTWYRSQPVGKVYIGNVFYAFKGPVPENGIIEIKNGTVGIAERALLVAFREEYGPIGTINEAVIPGSVQYIGDFSVGFRWQEGDMGFPSPYRNFVIHCVPGSAAEEYAIKHGFQIAHLRTITLDDGTANVAYMNVRTGGTYWDLPVPIRRNHLFYGWYTAPIGGERVTTETVVTATTDHTLYARWLLWGNVTGDGSVDSRDLALLQSHLNFGHLIQVQLDLRVADVVLDGRIDSLDLALLQRYLNFRHLIPIELGVPPR